MRLRGREAELVVTECRPSPAPPAPPAPPTPPATAPRPTPAVTSARITLRLPEALKEPVERAAGRRGHLGERLAGAGDRRAPSHGGRPPATPPGGWTTPPGRGRRHITGFGRA